MKPPRFAYRDPVTRSEALALLDTYEDEAKLLAGGQSLIPLFNMRLVQPAHLVDINRLPDLAYIREEDGYLAIGGNGNGKHQQKLEFKRIAEATK